jgi:hypothetical protein
MKYINLTQGKLAIVDDDDYEYLNQFKWHINSCGYAIRRITVANRKQKVIFMHRIVAKTPDNMQTDHINRKKLDNRKSNLRHCTPSQNKANISKRSDNTSGYKGVIWAKRHRKWCAQIIVNGKLKNLGYYNDIEIASLAYKKAAFEYFGEFGRG